MIPLSELQLCVTQQQDTFWISFFWSTKTDCGLHKMTKVHKAKRPVLSTLFCGPLGAKRLVRTFYIVITQIPTNLEFGLAVIQFLSPDVGQAIFLRDFHAPKGLYHHIFPDSPLFRERLLCSRLARPLRSLAREQTQEKLPTTSSIA